MPQIAGDRLSGRGGYDMLGAVAAMLEALPHVPEYGQGRVRVRLVLVDKEEGPPPYPFPDYIKRVGQGAGAPQFVVIGEPTNLEVARATKGAAWVRFTVRGVGGHSSVPWRLSNPIDWAIVLEQQLRQLRSHASAATITRTGRRSR